MNDFEKIVLISYFPICHQTEVKNGGNHATNNAYNFYSISKIYFWYFAIKRLSPHCAPALLVTPFTKHLYGCKALSHTLVKYGFVEFLFTCAYFFFSPYFFFLSLLFFVCYFIKSVKMYKLKKNAISVSAEKVSAPIPIPIPIVSADTFGRYRISVGH